MKTPRMVRVPASALFAWGLVFVLCGCYSTQEIETYGQLSEARDLSLMVMTVDTTVYELSRFAFSDSLLIGVGAHVVAGHSVPFSGSIPMSHIVHIRTQSVNVAGTVFVVAITALAAATAVNSISGGGFSVYRRMGGDGIFVSGLAPPGKIVLDPSP